MRNLAPTTLRDFPQVARLVACHLALSTSAFGSMDNAPVEDGGVAPTMQEEDEEDEEPSEETDLASHHKESVSRDERGVVSHAPSDEKRRAQTKKEKKRVKAVAPHPNAVVRHSHSAEEGGAEEHHNYSLALYLPVSDKFVWRGIPYYDDWNLQPYVSFSIFDVGPGTLGLNAWSYVSLEDSSTHEISPGLTYNLSGENYSLTPGYSVFIQTTGWNPYFHAFYFKADLLQSLPVYPTAGIMFDPISAKLALGFAGIKMSHAFGDLVVGGRLLAGAIYTYDVPTADGGAEDSLDFHHIDPSVYAAYPFGKHFSLMLSGGVGYDARQDIVTPWWQLTPSVTF